MKRWSVTVPIAGHAITVVEAASKEEAIAMAVETVDRHDLEDWKALERFNQGNICHCPQPWEAEAEEE